MPMTLHDINGIEIFAEQTGEGQTLVFVHEFGGDIRSWQGQIDALSGRYRCVVYSARGYPPSAVPAKEDEYGWELAVHDLKGVLDCFRLDEVFLIGLSMGAYTSLMAALRYPGRIKGVVFASGGTGAHADTRHTFQSDARTLADLMLSSDSTDHAAFLEGATRIQLQNKNAQAWRHFANHFREHDAAAMAYTLRHVQAARPSLYEFEAELKALECPVMLVAGDEDDAVLEINLWLKRTMPYSALTVLPKTGHLLNLEEPARFNGLIEQFVGLVEAGNWPRRDQRSQPKAKSGPRV
jgi:pimeloyl-ACP methyl ester carboxylesterase